MQSNFDPHKNRKMLLSNSPAVRTKAWLDLYDDMISTILGYFLYRTNNLQDSEDLAQDTFVNGHRHLTKNPLKRSSNPRGFAMKIAANIWKDKLRKTKGIKIFSLEETWPSNPRIHLPDMRWEFEKRIDRNNLLHIENDYDRFLAVMRYFLGFSPNQIALLTGLDIKDIQNSMKRINRESQKIFFEHWKYLYKTNRWQDQLHFTRDNHPISVAYVNVSPNNFHPDCWEKIKKDLDVSSVSELQEQFIAMDRVEGVDIESTIFVLTLTPRKFFSTEVFYEGKEIHYASYMANFVTEYKNSERIEYLVLKDKFEFPGRVTGNYDSKQHLWHEFEYQFPTVNMKARKAFNVRLLEYRKNPQSREPTLYVYRNYPLDPNQPPPLPLI